MTEETEGCEKCQYSDYVKCCQESRANKMFSVKHNLPLLDGGPHDHQEPTHTMCRLAEEDSR